ncbi:hypothetical protein ACPVPU_15230 [Sphingomonas sp. CJ99]
MMVRRNPFHDPLYAYGSADPAAHSATDRQPGPFATARRYATILIGGFSAIALLLWQSGAFEPASVGASTEAFARDDAPASSSGPGGTRGVAMARAATSEPAGPQTAAAITLAAARPREQAPAQPMGDAGTGTRRDASSQGRVGQQDDKGSALAARLSGMLPGPQTQTFPVFGRCGGGGIDCVVDGARFRWGKLTIELADAEVPNLRLPACPAESVVASRAQARLVTLLNQGPFVVSREAYGEGARGSERRLVTRGGRSIGVMMIDEGLARKPGAATPRWC